MHHAFLYVSEHSLKLPCDKWQGGHMYIKWIKRIKNELLTCSKNVNCTKKLAEIELFTKDFLDIFLPRDWESLNKQNLFRKAQWYSLGKEQQFIMWTLLTLINVVIIKRFHSRGHKLCNFIGTNKESFYIKLRPLGQPKRVICLATLGPFIRGKIRRVLHRTHLK